VRIRRPEPEELVSVRAVVQTVVDEICGSFGQRRRFRSMRRTSSWVAVGEAKLIGVVRTSGEWLDDLRVLPGGRGPDADFSVQRWAAVRHANEALATTIPGGLVEGTRSECI
jgi:hypothetical protein